MKKWWMSVMVVGLLVVGFFSLNSYIYQQKQHGAPVVPYQGTLTGEYVCLPHANQNGLQTLECALGMKTESGEYYALDFQALSPTLPDLKTGEKFSATGTITPIEMLSSNNWQKYNIRGIMSVSQPVKKL